MEAFNFQAPSSEIQEEDQNSSAILDMDNSSSSLRVESANQESDQKMQDATGPVRRLSSRLRKMASASESHEMPSQNPKSPATRASRGSSRGRSSSRTRTASRKRAAPTKSKSRSRSKSVTKRSVSRGRSA